MKTYKKKPISEFDQIKTLIRRGLSIEDEENAKHQLQEISYYRLSAYSIPYQQVKDQFDDGVTFQKIINTYHFDKELRLLVFDCIEKIEISIRTQLINKLSLKYMDSHWQDNKSLFKPAKYNGRTDLTIDIYNNTQKIINKHLTAKHPEVFIKHYITSYNSPKNPPCWMSLELLTIGELSRLYTALKHNEDKQEVASFFHLHHKVFTSWLHTLVYARNLCAHHSRIWNREFAIKPDALLKPQKAWLGSAFNTVNNRSLYFISILKYLLNSINPKNQLKEKFTLLLAKYPEIPIKYMGIPSIGEDKLELIDWAKEPLWL
jgi:abortive infection bacteriophage resistance protein